MAQQEVLDAQHGVADGAFSYESFARGLPGEVARGEWTPGVVTRGELRPGEPTTGSIIASVRRHFVHLAVRAVQYMHNSFRMAGKSD